MNKELEEAIILLKEMQDNALIACRCYKTSGVLYRDKKAEQKVNAIEIVLSYIENSIHKEKIEERIKEKKKLSKYFYEKFLETNRLDDDLRTRGIALDAQIFTLNELLEEK